MTFAEDMKQQALSMDGIYNCLLLGSDFFVDKCGLLKSMIPRASRMPAVTVIIPIQAGRPGISCRIGIAARAATTGTAERNTDVVLVPK